MRFSVPPCIYIYRLYTVCIYLPLADCIAAEDDNDGIIRPPLPLIEFNYKNNVDTFADDKDGFSLQPLLDEFGDRWQFQWIRQRMLLMWPEIKLAGRHVTNASCTDRMRSRLRVS